MTKHHKPAPTRPTIRCAIYTRKSTEEGLEQDFNSLDAQRESGEAFIKSQAHEGWVCLDQRYDDGGFSGGTMDRPALRRLLADIEAGTIDAVIVYKVDRLSRSLLDFARILEIFDKHHVSFVAVTQQINSATSMGRLMLNVLLSFAQFEREIISERTRDKIAAARRRGKWAGGHPVLGFDVDPQGFKLVVNADEAVRVRAIFELYLEHEGMLGVLQELQRRGWRNKSWTTRKGRQRGGKPFSKSTLHKLLTNVTYIGRIRYKNEVHDGEHAAIIDAEVWQKVQALLVRNGRTGGAVVRNKFGALLKGLLRCAPCGCAMTPSHTTRQGKKRYRYYVCSAAQKRGWQSCPSKSVPASEIERFVVERIRCIGRDPALQQETFAAARAEAAARVEQLETERRGLAREQAQWHTQVRQLLEQSGSGGLQESTVARLADLQERLRTAERRAAEIDEQVRDLRRGQISGQEVAQTLAAFDPIWETLTPHEQARFVGLLVERVDYDGSQKVVSITFHPSGIQALADELAARQQEKSA
jgi:site-specific DNA recombinase